MQKWLCSGIFYLPVFEGFAKVLLLMLFEVDLEVPLWGGTGMQSLTGMGTTGSIFLGSELLSAKGGPFKRDVSYIYEKKNENGLQNIFSSGSY